VSRLLEQLPGSERARAVRRDAPPGPSALMKAVLTDARFSDPEWVFERKLDGIRCLAVRYAGRLQLRSRNDLDLTGRYPELAVALGRQPLTEFAVDGEVVAFSAGQTSFARLAERGHRRVTVYLYAFDLLWLEGWDVRPLSLRARKRLLRHSLVLGGPLRRTPVRNGAGEDYYRHACAHGWEGLMAKRADSPYRAARSHDWLKLKCGHEQELVIGGFTAPRGAREHLGALLLGHYLGGKLRYAGKVGTGFDRHTLSELRQRLRDLVQAEPPFADSEHVPARAVTWVSPRLVAQIGFSEWTRDGRLRHPRFLGLRDDKAAQEVVRERPGPVGGGSPEREARR
jgi:bifunctional non-homologous end joining protein LigD